MFERNNANAGCQLVCFATQVFVDSNMAYRRLVASLSSRTRGSFSGESRVICVIQLCAA